MIIDGSVGPRLGARRPAGGPRRATRLADVLARVPERFHLGGPGRCPTRALSPGPEQGRPYHGPLLQQGAARSRPVSSRRRRSPTWRRWWSRWRRSARPRLSTAAATSSSTRCSSPGSCPMIAERCRRPAGVRRAHDPGRCQLRQPGVDRGLRDHRRPSSLRRPARGLRCGGLRRRCSSSSSRERRPRPTTARGSSPPLQAGTPTVPVRPARRAAAARRRRVATSTDPCLDRVRLAGRVGAES